MNLTISSPAKVNLYLAVLGRLTTGYHLLSSVVSPIALCDEVGIEVSKCSSGVEIDCCYSAELSEHLEYCRGRGLDVEKSISDISGPNNLAVKAAKAFLSTFGLEESWGVKISIQKRIPFQAGLGGGSSNAASTIFGLASLMGYQKHRDVLYRLASSIGSDVSAVLSGTMIYIHGTGDKMVPVAYSTDEVRDFYRSLSLILVKPPCGVSTPEAYQALGFKAVKTQQKSRDLFCIPARIGNEPSFDVILQRMGLIPCFDHSKPNYGDKQLTLFKEEGSSPLLSGNKASCQKVNEHILSGLRNDFEDVVFKQVPEILELKNLLELQGVSKVMLAGSGSSLFGVVVDRSNLESIFGRIRSQLPRGCFVMQSKLLVPDDPNPRV